MNQLTDESKKVEGATLSDAQLREELEKERKARQDAEQRAGYFQGAAASEWNRAERASRQSAPEKPSDPLTDPFAKLAAEDPLLDPEKRARLLDEGARARAREEAMKITREYDAKRQMESAQMEARMALRMFQSAHPEISADGEGFAAAMTRAKVRADAKGMNLDPMGMLELGMQVYNEQKASSQSTPYTEAPSSAGRPGGPKAPEPEVPPSMAEELYGATDFVDERKLPLDKYTEAYLDDRNLSLVEKEKFWSGIRNVVGDVRAAKSRKAAAGR